MPSLLSLLASRIAEKFRGPGDATARRRRNLYKDKFWTAIELLEDRTLLSGTAPQFVPVAQESTTQEPRAVATGDLNNDGRSDVVAGLDVGTEGQSTLLVALAHSEGVMQTPFELPLTDGVLAVALGDINNDGALDIVTASQHVNEGTSITVSWWQNDGDGTSFTRHDLAMPSGTFDARLAVGDFDGDSNVDVALATTAFGPEGLDTRLYVATNSPVEFQGGWEYFPGAFDAAVATVSGQVADLKAGDLDANGTLDVLLATNRQILDQSGMTVVGNEGLVRWFSSDNSSVSSDAQTVVDTTASSAIITGFDVGYEAGGAPETSPWLADLAVSTRPFNPQTGTGAVDLYVDFQQPEDQEGSAGFASSSTLGTGAPDSGESALGVQFGDVDGDGYDDVLTLFVNSEQSEIAWYQNLGDGNFAPRAALVDGSQNVTRFAAAFESFGETGMGVGGLVTGQRVLGGETVPGILNFYRPVADSSPTIAVNAGATVDEGGSVGIEGGALQATDAEQSALALVYTVTVAPQHGVLRLNLGAGEYATLGETATFTQYDIDAGLISYLHDGSETTDDAFSFTVTDGTDTTEEAAFNITVTPVNDAPTLVTSPAAGAEFRVGDHPSGTQNDPAVGRNEHGETVVAWSVYDSIAGAYDVYAQRYDAAGSAVGSSFRVNTHVADGQNGAAVAVGSDGGFVIAWHSNRQDDPVSLGIYAQRYAADGTALGGEFRVSTTIPNQQQNPVIAIGGNGDFVIVWNANLQDDPQNLAGVQFGGFGVFGQRYNAQGQAVGGEFQVNTHTNNNQENPSVAMDAAGNFVVAWTSADQDVPGFGVYLQRYDAAGNRIGAEHRVSDVGLQGRVPAVAMSPDGDFVVAWSSYELHNWDVRAQRFDSSGAEVGSEFRVNTQSSGRQWNPSIAMNADGDFVVAWTSLNQDGGGDGVYAQRFDAAGVAVGDEFLVNSFISSNQYISVRGLGLDAEGGFLIAWTSEGQDGNSAGVFARRFDVAPGQITVREGATVVIGSDRLQTTDVDLPAQTLTYTITSAPLYGSLLLDNVAIGVGDTFTQEDIDGGQLTYSHGGGEVSTSDAFSFTISDGQGGEIGETTFAITVVPTNDAPTAVDGELSLLQDTPVAIDLADIDSLPLVFDAETADLDDFTYEVVSVTHGTTAVNPAEGNTNPRFIIFTPDLGYVGPAVITVRATDNGDRGAPPRSVEYEITVDLTAPIALDDSANVDEDGTVTINVLANDTVYGQGESNAIQITDPSPYGTAVVNADRTITFTPNANFNGQTSFQYTLVNAGGMTRVATVTVNVASINDAPAGTDNTVATPEDTPYTFTIADFGFSDESDLPSNSLLSVIIVAKPHSNDGTLKLDGSDISDGQVVLATDIAAGKLVFTPFVNGHGDASFTFKVKDNGGTANGGVDTDPTANTMTITVASVNDAPDGADNTITTNEDTPYTFTTADFGFADPDDDPANGFFAVTIDTLPAGGTLKLAGADVEAGDSISAADIDDGLLVFHPADNAPTDAATGAPYASFTFRVQDDGGIANDGVDTDPSANTITINVTPDADTPTLEVADPDVVAEDAEGAGVTIPLSVSSSLTDADGSENLSVIISGVPVGVTLTDGTSTFTSSLANGGTSPNIAGWNLGSLVAVVPEHFAFDFTLSVTARATERANGDFATTSDTIFVAITAVADAPTLTTSDVTRNEDQTIPLTVSTALVDADGSESLTVFVKGLPAGVVVSDGTVAHTVESAGEDQWIDITGWTLSDLRLTPVAHSDQDFQLTFKSKATESENGEFATTERTLDVTVVAVADAPILTVSAGTGDEDTAIDIPVSTSLVDAIDGSETLTITVEGAPAGSVFTDGSNEAPVDVDGQVIDITGWNLANLKVTPPEHSGDDFTLTFRSTATEARDDSTAQTVRSALVTVKAVADAPTLTASSPGGDEDTPIALVINPALVDADGSETLRIVLSGIPLGAIVQDGFGQNDHRTQLGDTSVDVTTWNLASLTITPPLNFRGTINLTATATATEEEIWPGQSVATTVVPFDVVVLPVNDTPHVDPTVQPTIFQDGFHFDALNRPVDLGYIEFDLRAYLTDVETDPDDFTFEIEPGSVVGGTAVVNPDGNIARFTPDPDFVGIARFTYRATDTGDLPGADPHSPPITRTGTITVQVLRYQDLGDAPDSYGTTAPDAGPRDQGGARHGGQHDDPNPIRLGRIVGYGETNGQPSDDANVDDLTHSSEDPYGGSRREDGSFDDEDGVAVLTGIEARDDKDLVRTLRIEAPAGGKLDAWIDFNRDGDFDTNERLKFVLEDGTISSDSYTLSGGADFVNFVKVVIPHGLVDFSGGVDDDGKPVELSQVSTYGRFRISSAGGLDAIGFAADGEVEDYVVALGNRNPTPGGLEAPGFEAALEAATDLFIEQYADELIADPDYVPPNPGEAGYVPMIFSGAGDGGENFEKGEIPEELKEILGKINGILAPGRGLTENVFIFVSHPVDFVITDPSGRTAGHTATGGTFNNIGANVSYSGDGAIELLVIRGASAGEYKIEFTGVGGVFRGGSSFITAAGVQQSAFQGALASTQDVALSLEFTAPTFGTLGGDFADAGGRNQAFFNVNDDAGTNDEDDALSALAGLDSENDSGLLDPRQQILQWIDAVRGTAKSARRVVLDELEPDWLVDDSEETQALLDEFWTGLGASMLGNIPAQVFQLGEFLGVDVPLLFAPESNGDGAQQAKQPAGKAAAETDQSSNDRKGDNDSDGAGNAQSRNENAGNEDGTDENETAENARSRTASGSAADTVSGWLTALAGRRPAPFGSRSSKFARP